MTEKTSGITGYHLKLIALITMLVDHIGAVVLLRIYKASQRVFFLVENGSVFIGTRWAEDTFTDNLLIWAASNQELIYTIYEYIRLIGRMAFPLYCFLIVEGFLHTKSFKKYALRLLAFAFISEIPFDLALTGQWISWEYSNVFFTLVIGLILIWLASYVELFYEFWKEKKWDDNIGIIIFLGSLIVLCFIFGGFAEMVLHTDYGLAGVLAILVMYLLRKQRELGYAAAVLLLSILTSSTEIIALLMLVPLINYNGLRGRNIKYVFYIFYPAHLLVLALICMGLGV